MTRPHQRIALTAWRRRPNRLTDDYAQVLAAAKSAGCSILIATSSSSVSMRPRSFFALPWGKFPKDGFQVCNDLSMESLDRPLSDFFGCYAYSKARAEKLVREADDPENGFRTGVIRPGHAIYGHGDENPMSLTWDYLRRGGSPTWLRYMGRCMLHMIFHLYLCARALQRGPVVKTSVYD